MSSPSDSESDAKDDDDWSEDSDGDEEDGDEDRKLPPVAAILSFSFEPLTLNLKLNSPMSVSHSSVVKSSMNGRVLSRSLLGRGLDRILRLPT